MADVITELKLAKGTVVLDPWNGTGTTTTTASRKGLASIGIDVNPVLVLIAKSRFVQRSALTQCGKIARAAVLLSRESETQLSSLDALSQWFDCDTATAIRSLEVSIYSLAIDGHNYRGLFHHSSLRRVSNSAALLYVALFLTTRALLQEFRGSNPAWIKTAKTPSELIAVQSRKLHSAFLANVKTLTDVLQAVPDSQSAGSCILNVGSSAALPLQADSVGAIITSPPYCTRLDYVVATLPELAIIGAPRKDGLRSLRSEMIGTPTIISNPIAVAEAFGPTCRSFLSKVRAHRAKASHTYYATYFAQYFQALRESLCELDRVLARNGRVVFVVQDSFYKDVRNDLATIVSEMVLPLGWKVFARKDFTVRYPMVRIHRGARTYRKAFTAVESAIAFTKV